MAASFYILSCILSGSKQTADSGLIASESGLKVTVFWVGGVIWLEDETFLKQLSLAGV